MFVLLQPLRARLSADLLTAMKARDQAAIDTLRCLLAVLDNVGATLRGLSRDNGCAVSKPTSNSASNHADEKHENRGTSLF